ncbi:MAG TPA: hypothetical protein VGH79_00230 [Gaiellaceae bacterium]|jgi:hypothetical protein
MCASALASGLGVPILLVIVSAVVAVVTWIVRSSIEDIREAERSLADERRAIYERVLEPYLITLLAMGHGDEAEAQAQQAQTALFASPEYRRAVFDLTLFASDPVIRAVGDITNNDWRAGGPENPLVLWARLLRAIRKSVGNKGTRLTLLELLRPSINDADNPSDSMRQLLTDKN